MNQLSLVGRIVRTPILREGSAKPRVNFTIAVDRNGEGTDWIPCVAWGPTATAIAEYTDKGHLVAIEGRLSTGKYTNDAGETVYTLDVIGTRVGFISKPRNATTTPENVDPVNGTDETEAA